MSAVKSLRVQPDEILKKTEVITLEKNRLKTPTFSSRFKERSLQSVDKLKPFVTMMKHSTTTRSDKKLLVSASQNMTLHGQLYPEFSASGRHMVNQSLNLVHINRRNKVLNLNTDSTKEFVKTNSNFTLNVKTDDGFVTDRTEPTTMQPPEFPRKSFRNMTQSVEFLPQSERVFLCTNKKPIEMTTSFPHSHLGSQNDLSLFLKNKDKTKL